MPEFLVLEYISNVCIEFYFGSWNLEYIYLYNDLNCKFTIYLLRNSEYEIDLKNNLKI